jgi:hypothetical protein
MSYSNDNLQLISASSFLKEEDLQSQMLKLLVKVMNLDDRAEFGERVLAAKDENEMLKVIIAMYVYLDTPSKKSDNLQDLVCAILLFIGFCFLAV